MAMSFMEAIKNRRTYYSIGNEEIVDYKRIREIVTDAVKYVPSSFNSQSSRVVILFGDEHRLLWDMTKEELKKITPPERFQATEDKINSSFRSGYGSVLYFEDMNTVEGLQERFPLYSENFPIWSNQASGMLQFVIWTALEAEGLGASLQHYNPIIDNAVKLQWNIPAEWKLIAQMPFGKPIALPADKEFKSIDERLKVF